MRAKQMISSVNWTEKNQIYLSRLGLLDNRSGRKRKEAGSVSDFINKAVTIVLESNMTSYNQMASSEELRIAYYKFVLVENNKRIEDLQIENIKLAKHIEGVRLEVQK